MWQMQINKEDDEWNHIRLEDEQIEPVGKADWRITRKSVQVVDRWNQVGEGNECG